MASKRFYYIENRRVYQYFSSLSCDIFLDRNSFLIIHHSQYKFKRVEFYMFVVETSHDIKVSTVKKTRPMPIAITSLEDSPSQSHKAGYSRSNR